MKLRQNARELVLIELAGMGLFLGEIRYNKQTETALFALEKSAFFDLYFPCIVTFDQKRGPVVQPHAINVMTTSSIRIQRSRVSFFVMEQDIVPGLKAQYMDFLSQLTKRPASPPEPAAPLSPVSPVKGGSPRVVDLKSLKDKKDDPKTRS